MEDKYISVNDKKPTTYDLVDMKCVGDVLVKGWWTGCNWEVSLPLGKKVKVISWKKIPTRGSKSRYETREDKQGKGKSFL